MLLRNIKYPPEYTVSTENYNFNFCEHFPKLQTVTVGLCVCMVLSSIHLLRFSSFVRQLVIVIWVLLKWGWERIIMIGETRIMESAWRRDSVQRPIGCGCARKWLLYIVIIIRKTYIWIHFVGNSSDALTRSNSDENTLAIWERKVKRK